jgi:hypothetical protein
MVSATGPYDLPIWRRSHRASSPDGRFVAEVDPAHEVSISNPTSGVLCLSAGLHLDRCSPAFTWSADSRYLAVPRFFVRMGLLRRQRLLVVDVHERRVFASKRTAHCFQPESFEGGELVALVDPHRRRELARWRIPESLAVDFDRTAHASWSQAGRSASAP